MSASSELRPFRYMEWAKEHASRARYHLGLSGLAPPSAELLPLDEELDLAQRGYDMPPRARRRLADRFGVGSEQLMLTLGTSHALYLLAATVLRPGDLCLVERPTYELLVNLPGIFGARVERFERSMESGFRPDADLLERVQSLRPTMVWLTNPHNPTGAMLERGELEPLARACAAVGAVLVIDEVYLEYFVDAPDRTAFGLADTVVTCSSFTKAFGLGTVRFGWLLASETRVAQAIAYNNYISVLYPNPSAWVGLAALDRLPQLQQRATSIRDTNLPIVRAWIEARHDVGWHEPEAGVICFPRFERMADMRVFVEALLRERDTLVVPGSFFEAPAHARLGFGTDEATLREGLCRIGAALDTFDGAST